MEVIKQKSCKSWCWNIFFKSYLIRFTIQYHHMRFLTFEWRLPGKPILHYLHWRGYQKLDFSPSFRDNNVYNFSIYLLVFELLFTTEGKYFRERV
ncbi:hypothetical protein VF04_04065 [Nostoc linckia z7]|uniref:Uncharacterized protein n=2 Tax=Nostoc linckia TaxID=92942 RepID=A0A9Q6EN47_NOSLI|nr:hypothetical protein VF02_11550 [Nostoc linckia z1]PHJ70144.1 hypothetical protein VF05_11710 [Nostoc linckia z3]PHJ75045.1 hypothetical protein VF03_11870 [Nostoc linckia z2]PHJ82933.1 hypothetical protein VF06_14370 [Nostoc linckia z4]PHJ89030.1 hypothetical protein VF07_13565 [Nostoc linckia z6]PHK00089.1 hypothetical protein VF04_04065 [Nostoc linckia z7]PHK06752.1 hypothetical protein VF08_03195 [Nostoc linckia z8]PHK23245.1 hypothetical protein VF11_02730 [Nostoc linckia z14]PHK269